MQPFGRAGRYSQLVYHTLMKFVTCGGMEPESAWFIDCSQHAATSLNTCCHDHHQAHCLYVGRGLLLPTA